MSKSLSQGGSGSRFVFTKDNIREGIVSMQNLVTGSVINPEKSVISVLHSMRLHIEQEINQNFSHLNADVTPYRYKPSPLANIGQQYPNVEQLVEKQEPIMQECAYKVSALEEQLVDVRLGYKNKLDAVNGDLQTDMQVCKAQLNKVILKALDQSQKVRAEDVFFPIMSSMNPDFKNPDFKNEDMSIAAQFVGFKVESSARLYLAILKNQVKKADRLTEEILEKQKVDFCKIRKEIKDVKDQYDKKLRAYDIQYHCTQEVESKEVKRAMSNEDEYNTSKEQCLQTILYERSIIQNDFLCFVKGTSCDLEVRARDRSIQEEQCVYEELYQAMEHCLSGKQAEQNNSNALLGASGND